MSTDYQKLVINRSHPQTNVQRPNSMPIRNNPISSTGNSQHNFNYQTPNSSHTTKSSSKINNWLYTIPVAVFGVALGVSYLLFKPAPPTVVETEVVAEDDSSLLDISGEPKTEACPLNGKLYTKTEKDSWDTRRPLAVMIENTPDARPQSGLSNADIVFEAVAEGGITRFMGLFYCGAQAEDIILAPIRSARTYYLDLASGFNYPLYVHVGGANVPGPTDALGQIEDYGWAGENDINQFSVGYPTFYRNNNRLGRAVATEHTMETSTEGLWKVGEKRGWTNMSPELKVGRTTVPASDWQEGYTGWTFADGTPSSSPTASNINYNFWSGYNAYDVTWKYDATTNTYLRFQGSGDQTTPFTDLNNDQQVSASDVVIMFVEETGPINEQKHMLYDVIGSGKAQIFKNGEVYDANWKKQTRESEITFTGKDGKAFEFTPGLIWISVLPDTNKVSYN